MQLIEHIAALAVSGAARAAFSGQGAGEISTRREGGGGWVDLAALERGGGLRAVDNSNVYRYIYICIYKAVCQLQHIATQAPFHNMCCKP